MKEEKETRILTSSCRKYLMTIAVFASSMSRLLFAAADDLGIIDYLDSVRSILLAIGAGLLVLSLGTWAVKAILKKNVDTQEWKAIGVMAMGGVVLIIAPSLVDAIFGSSLGETGN